MLDARRSPKRATAVAVFDKLVAFPSLLTHPNLTIEVLLLREDHIRGQHPTTRAGRTRDPGERRLVEVLDRIAMRTPEACSRRCPRSRASVSPEPDDRLTYSNGVRKTLYRDPDGNELGFGGAPLDAGS